MTDLDKRQEYILKRQIEDLKKQKGRHTELISLYVPPDKQISDVTSYLRNELSESQNIKSKQTRKNVLSAIESIMSRLKSFKKIPENGLVFFVGYVQAEGDQTEMMAHVIEPPLKINTFLYRCDSDFYVEPLEDMLVEKDIYGLLLIDRRECTIGLLRGNRVELLKYMTSQVPGKHGKGGQSQQRFERLTEIAAHEWFKKCGEKASKILKDIENLAGIFIGGPGPTKKSFVDEEYLHYELQDKILEVFDTGYTDEFGLREMVNAAAETRSNLKIAREKKLMKKFLREITKREKGLSVYGENLVRKALQMGAVDKLLLSEDLRKYRVKIQCPTCDYSKYVTIKEEELDDYEPPICSDCDEKSQMEIIEKKDLIDELSELAENTSSKIELISRESEEGESLYSAFEGVAGILRYPIGL
ncbi:MAG: peptide chain release factor aRF-1 [Candidatus Thermoplasmatota archaeon]